MARLVMACTLFRSSSPLLITLQCDVYGVEFKNCKIPCLNKCVKPISYFKSDLFELDLHNVGFFLERYFLVFPRCRMNYKRAGTTKEHSRLQNHYNEGDCHLDSCVQLLFM